MFRYASIDIGSNAVRLLLCNVSEEHGQVHYNKGELIRIPLRLGEDVFSSGKISAKKIKDLIKTMRAFNLLIDVFNPDAHRACATASLREAKNGHEVVQKIAEDSGLKIEIIDGKTEAEIIYSNHTEELLNHEKAYLYIDVGGGSTEITLFNKGIRQASRSFNIGTLRWLQGKVSKVSWIEMKDWVEEITRNHGQISAIGSGGNINKIFKMLGRKDKPLLFSQLKELYSEMKPLSIEERMEKWGFNPDRADVIVPATKIFLGVMRSAGAERIYVPQIGLVDGIVHQLHENRTTKR
ncbi:MAG TPA: exopolyphosphatase [Bacteroidia bacterium]|nr:exopolyphosphatase [Bacteroidia bacterium]HNS12291.1 exopolyphosphatase [Bacteroidia bacterium]